MNRRELLLSSLLGGVGAATAALPANALEFPSNYDASKELERPDWKPVFMDEHQNATLIVLSDLIIPSTDTPGAKEALVNRFLDLLMSAESAETQRAFFAALGYMDGACMERYGAAFVYVSHEKQIEFLDSIVNAKEAETSPGHVHFEKLKQWISGAFYSSAIGLKELGWDGSFPHGELTGCTHDAGAHQGEAS